MARNTISKKFIKDYLIENYGEVRHDLDAFTYAIRETANEYELNKKDLFFYMIERRATIALTTSYGFDTRYGREIREKVQYHYNTYEK